MLGIALAGALPKPSHQQQHSADDRTDDCTDEQTVVIGYKPVAERGGGHDRRLAAHAARIKRRLVQVRLAYLQGSFALAHAAVP